MQSSNNFRTTPIGSLLPCNYPDSDTLLSSRRARKKLTATRTTPAYVPIGAVHRLANPGKIPLELIEVQLGGYFGEDDILRREDVCRRLPD
jgi:Mannose-6-phosphate isomerase